jgi:hypothetical protein
MAVQLSVAARNARLDAIETTIGTSAILQIRSGAAPANCAAADSGTLLASLSLPSDWMAAAASGAKALSGTWQDLSADASGTIGHFRVKDSGGSVTHIQGTAGLAGDMVTDAASTTAGQSFTVNTFTLTDANA